MFIKYNHNLAEVAPTLRNNSTPAEIEMWLMLKSSFPEYRFLRQKPLDNFIIDFYCPKYKLIIEIDGEIHNLSKDRDAERDNFFKTKYNINTIRFTNDQVYKDKEFILKSLHSFFKSPSLPSVV